jgi:DNA-binding CsgD family transcriptional regulator
MEANRTDALSPRERECLRLVTRNFSSKEIGRELGISNHTVDDHIKHAISVLGVASRFDAARLLADAEGPPQALGTQPQAVAELVIPGPAISPDRSDAGFFRNLPFLRNGRRTNDLSSTQRLLWIAISAVVFIIAFAQLASGLKALLSVKDGMGL